MKHKILNILYLLILIAIPFIAESCADDFPYYGGDIPEGEGNLSATVTFTPNSTADLGDTRTAGNAIKDINSLCVLVYSPKGDLIKKYYGVSQSATGTGYDFKYKDETYTVKPEDHLDGNEAKPDEKTTAKANFSLTGLPYGMYKIYAVANMGDMSTDNTTFINNEGQTVAIKDAIATEDGLKNIKLSWKTDISQNDQMFGYFTPANNMVSNGFDAPTIVFKPGDTEIHAWLKRVVSKVTVAFDPSGLNQGVTIYIRSVTIRDIPKTCLLGAENTPSSYAELDNHLSGYEDPDYEHPTSAINGSRLEYNDEGVITADNEHTGTSSTAGLELNNSIRSAVPEGAHNADAPSLFFYENNQNSYLEGIDRNYKNNPLYNKRPQKEGEDAIGSVIHDNDGENDFKDRVPYGSYVEVDAYYISSNPANPGEGSIKYRFMLGKDISFDYDAQRNYHFKLTLGFNGWANDPDWHIDYVITNPGIEVPPVFRVSYLYHQKSELPIRIIGDIEYLTVTIEENNWAPYDTVTKTNQTVNLGGKIYQVPQSEITGYGDPRYDFKWNYDAFINDAYRNPAPTGPDYPDNLPQGQECPQFGFLALHLPNKETTRVSTSFGSGANSELKTKWKNDLEGVRRFRGGIDGSDDFSFGDHPSSWGDIGHSFPEEDNKYTVNKIYKDNGEEIDNQRVLMLPLWTRTKTLINTSGFSGNNPYEAFERKARLHIVAQFKDGTRLEDNYVDVFQVKRLTNPKGVWRSHDRTEAFNVVLLEPENSNAESNFQPFTSQGEWTAFLDGASSKNTGFSIRPNGKTNGYIRNDTIHGNTGSEIHFAINFDNKVEKNESQCAIVKVMYHGNQCMHKILVRKGYNEPLEMGGTNGKKKWSSFALYQATNAGRTENGRQVFNAVLTKNPLMLGSMFRRGRQDQGIFVWNNMPDHPDMPNDHGIGPFVPPGDYAFVVGKPNNGVTIDPDHTGTQWKDQWQRMNWSTIDYRDDATVEANRNNNLGYFYATDYNEKTRRYRVPTYQEFQDLTDNSEFGFGVFYGSEATEPKTNAQDAYGLIDPYNQGLFDDPNGMRAVVAYDKDTGNQILFPVGRYGIGVRRMFNLQNIGGAGSYYNTFAGNLHYSDVYQPLTIGPNNDNLYRPIPYNLPIVSGCIYWIDQYAEDVHAGTGAPASLGRSCLGWDMNYFNFDFNSYTANNYRDACPMKFVIDEEE